MVYKKKLYNNTSFQIPTKKTRRIGTVIEVYLAAKTVIKFFNNLSYEYVRKYCINTKTRITETVIEVYLGKKPLLNLLIIFLMNVLGNIVLILKQEELEQLSKFIWEKNHFKCINNLSYKCVRKYRVNTTFI